MSLILVPSFYGVPKAVHLQSIKRYAVRCFAALAMTIIFVSLGAAQDNFSHRRIPLPEHGTKNIVDQFRIMQQLQQLMHDRVKPKDGSGSNGASSSSAKSSLTPPGLDPRMLQQLLQSLDPKQRQAVDQLAKQLASPEGLPDSVLDQLKADSEKIPNPKMREQFREILDQYRGMSSEQRSKVADPRVADPQVADSRALDPLSKQDDRKESSQARPKTETPPKTSSPPDATGQSLPNPFDYLNSSKDESKPNFTEPSFPEQSPSSESSSTNRRKRTDSSSQEPFKKSPNSPWDDRVHSSNARPLEDTRSREPDLGAAEIQMPKMEELLRKSEQQPDSLPPLKLPPNLSENFKRYLEKLQADLNAPKRDGKFLEQLKGALPPTLKEELRKSGVEQSMREVLQEARRGNLPSSQSSAQATPPNIKPPQVGPGPSNGLAASNSPHTSSEDSKNWLEKITGQQPGIPMASNSTTSKSTTSNVNRQSNGSNQSDGPPSQNKSILESFTEVYKSVTSPKSNPLADASLPDVTGVVSNRFLTSAGIAVAVIGMAFVGYLLFQYFSSTRGTGEKINQQTAIQLNGFEIRDRRDVVRVFNQLATRAGIPTEMWWPHPRAAGVMAAEAPWAQSAVDALSRLYEIARYTPEDQRLSDSQLDEARLAVKQFQATEKRSIW